MPSIIEGYNYDIFISYRQKDNKYDGWVTKFVDNLKKELEATFKEDVSVYFDENPHDRLQETHDVDKSLEGKLKCLIFIPILSQTYCDHNSYAWQHEFLAFLKMVKNDRFGKDVNLRSGNVSSRILPIRIHDLEPEDVKLYEKETGSVLRAMDFVFKTVTGAVRPLLPNEDHPNDNLYKTFYRDQISKAAIAIKEIVLGMKAEPVLEVKENDQARESVKEVREDERKIDLEKPAKTDKRRLISTVSIVIVLIIAAILFYPKFFKSDKLNNLRTSDGRISIAVMPFKNMTNDTTKNDWQDWIQDILITSLSNSEELKVRQSETINSYIQSKGFTDYASITPSVASNISLKLGANVFVYGSIIKEGAKIRVIAQLFDSNSEEVFKSFQQDGTAENILPIIDNLSIMVKDFLEISKLKKSVTPDIQSFASTNSSEAYRYFIFGENSRRKGDNVTAIKWYTQAIEIDSNFYFAYNMISFSYVNLPNLFEQGKKWCLKAYSKKDQMPYRQKLYADRAYAIYFGTPDEEVKCIKQLLEIDEEMPILHYNLGYTYNRLQQYDKAIPELEKALEIYVKLNSKPYWGANYKALGNAYHKTKEYNKEKELYKKAEQDFPNVLSIVYNQAALLLTLGDTIEANQYIEKYKSISKENSASEAAIETGLAGIYSEADIQDKAEIYYRQALSLEQESPARLNTLAYFLIDKDRNVNEGLELVEKALKLSPGYYGYLHTKGWGLYKQGKFQEAKEMLQKSWDLRRQNAIYDHEAFLHLEAAKKAVASQKRTER
jgi:tetratricopeptide (TPR) repeat protein